ncbi:hypothetical protein [Actinomadura sp. HBU206391]|uniref:hypothetical protein n=1 Tax=Actinomadura sp. HBU206391 TaxID=2731692 RepID=UPI00165096E9|nr:hypothetical protein [Actinomadura sp. HBU206391]MBC6460242.1 hypothetical protein [Actinomadura sp. HBU206391]
MASGVGRHTIPGTGTFFVGIDIAPGRYRCDDGKGGWWVRFAGPGGGEPIGSWPLPIGPTEVEIRADDFAFETHVSTYWRFIGSSSAADGRRPAEARPVADPGLRPELDALVARHGVLHRMAPLAIPLLCVLGIAFGGAWGLSLIPLAIIVLTGRHLSDDLRRARALKLRRDRYVTPDDFDEEGRTLLARAQGAIDAVQESDVNKEGLLDTVDNAVTLPRQEWEIAQVLARQAKLRGEQQAFLTSATTLPEVEAAIRPLREKLDLSVQAVTRRIEALERYAERTRAADEAFRAHRHLDTLSAHAAEYDELLADAVREDLALPAIERLTDQSDELVRTLRSRLADAADAGTELPPAAP